MIYKLKPEIVYAGNTFSLCAENSTIFSINVVNDLLFNRQSIETFEDKCVIRFYLSSGDSCCNEQPVNLRKTKGLARIPRNYKSITLILEENSLTAIIKR